jgi:TetR/AcrR family transcriptional regulator, tetracycline repressor protein
MLDFLMALDRKTILRCAFAVLNQSGYESLPLRRIADGLAFRPPTIYWHFKNKQELLDEMGTQVMREAVVDAPPIDTAQSWRAGRPDTV